MRLRHSTSYLLGLDILESKPVLMNGEGGKHGLYSGHVLQGKNPV